MSGCLIHGVFICLFVHSRNFVWAFYNYPFTHNRVPSSQKEVLSKYRLFRVAFITKSLIQASPSYLSKILYIPIVVILYRHQTKGF